MEGPHIIVAYNLTPSDVASLNRQFVLGIATDIGSKTSHAAIMARSLSIPAVVRLKDASIRLENGDYVLLDGTNGLVIVNPADQALWTGEIDSDEILTQVLSAEVIDQGLPFALTQIGRQRLWVSGKVHRVVSESVNVFGLVWCQGCHSLSGGFKTICL